MKICFVPACNLYAPKQFSFREWIGRDECFSVAPTLGIQNINAPTRIVAGVIQLRAARE